MPNIIIVAVIGDERDLDAVAISQTEIGPPWGFLQNNINRFLQYSTPNDVLIVDDETYDTIVSSPYLQKRLKDRTIIVLSNNPAYKIRYTVAQPIFIGRLQKPPFVRRRQVVYTFADAVNRANEDRRIYITGSQSLCQLALPYADSLRICWINKCEVLDTAKHDFLQITKDEWQTQSEQSAVCTTQKEKYNSIVREYKSRYPRPDPLVNAGATQYVNPENASNEEERSLMNKYQTDKKCPFCSPDRLPDHGKPIYEVKYCGYTEHKWPTGQVDILIYPKRHVDDLEALTDEEWCEIRFLYVVLKAQYKIKGGELVFYFGDVHCHTSSVAHLHARLTVPKKAAIVKKEAVLHAKK